MSFLQDMDNALFVTINQKWASPSFDFFMIGLSNPKIWIPLYLVIVVFTIIKYKTNAWLILIGIVAAFAISDMVSSRIFKPTFKRVRPCNVVALNPITPDGISKSYGFVSSHAANHMAIAIFVILAFGLKKWFKLAFVIWAIAIAYSRVYLGKHYVSDVFMGAILGCLVSYALWFFMVKPIAIKFKQNNIK